MVARKKWPEVVTAYDGRVDFLCVRFPVATILARSGRMVFNHAAVVSAKLARFLRWERGLFARPISGRQRSDRSGRKVWLMSPRSVRPLSSYYDESGRMDGSGLGEGAHGVVKRQVEDLGAEVDGVAALVPFWPAPVAFLDDEAGKSGHGKIAATGFN